MFSGSVRTRIYLAAPYWLALMKPLLQGTDMSCHTDFAQASRTCLAWLQGVSKQQQGLVKALTPWGMVKGPALDSLSVCILLTCGGERGSQELSCLTAMLAPCRGDCTHPTED